MPFQNIAEKERSGVVYRARLENRKAVDAHVCLDSRYAEMSTRRASVPARLRHDICWVTSGVWQRPSTNVSVAMVKMS